MVPQFMAGRTPKKKTTRKKAARKSTSSSRKSSSSKRRTTRSSKSRASSKKHNKITLFFFWPFIFVNHLTRKLSTPKKVIARGIGYPAVIGLAGLIVYCAIYGTRAQRFDLTLIHAMPERSIVLDRYGNEIARIHGEKRSVVPLKEVSPHFRDAILAREDERFYSHGAVDPIGIVRAFIKNLQGKREGASTITQQLASDVYQLKRGEKRGDLIRQIDRKMLEIAIAHRLEFAYSKDDLLEAYINQINWGRQIKGIGEASRIYFEKHPSELNLSESAMLAGIVRGPDAYNPFRSMEAATRERNTTLKRMVAADKISQADCDKTIKEKIKVRPEWRRRYQASYAMDTIRRDLEIILENEDIELGGLQITTTIDQSLQKKAEAAVDARLKEVEAIQGYRHTTRAQWQKIPEEGRKAPNYIQGAAVVVENRTGAILAVVGGRDANESQFNRAKDSRRPIGSIFKPFVYSAAFDRGLTPRNPVSDGPLKPGEIKKAGNWNPQNSDGKFGGLHPTAYGLIRSRNTMSIRVGDFAGIPKVKDVASRAGFTSDIPEVPASFLGTWDASPWEVATAYSIFPNGGQRYRPYIISEIQDRDGNVLYSTQPLPYQASFSKSAQEISNILQQVMISGTGASVKRHGFEKPCAGKTGTTNDFKDAWFAGFTSQLTCAVWVGFDQPTRTIYGGYGSFLALPIWAKIMKAADESGYTAGSLDPNLALVPSELCRISGKRATSGCHSAETAYTAWGPRDITLPESDFCPIHPARAVTLDDTRNAPKANPVTPPNEVRRAIPVEETPLRAIPVE